MTGLAAESDSGVSPLAVGGGLLLLAAGGAALVRRSSVATARAQR